MPLKYGNGLSNYYGVFYEMNFQKKSKELLYSTEKGKERN
jgi:hypothetical protein